MDFVDTNGHGEIFSHCIVIIIGESIEVVGDGDESDGATTATFPPLAK
jgi:hypothetical protein